MHMKWQCSKNCSEFWTSNINLNISCNWSFLRILSIHVIYLIILVQIHPKSTSCSLNLTPYMKFVRFEFNRPEKLNLDLSTLTKSFFKMLLDLLTYLNAFTLLWQTNNAISFLFCMVQYTFFYEALVLIHIINFVWQLANDLVVRGLVILLSLSFTELSMELTKKMQLNDLLLSCLLL